MRRIYIAILLLAVILMGACKPVPASVLTTVTPPATTVKVTETKTLPPATVTTTITSPPVTVTIPPITVTQPPTTTTPTQCILNVYFIDVGQGDSILLDQGTTEILIDGGTGTVNVANFIKQYVDEPLEVVVATHMDADHIGGLTAILNTFKVLNVWDNGDIKTTATYNSFKTAIQKSGAAEHIGRRGSTLQAGLLSFNILNPVDTTWSSNNNSIVLSLNYGDTSFLFTGDAEQEAEVSMLTAGVVPHADILKVGHHGSKTSSSQSFLSAIKPQVAVYMAGQGNTYGHPHPETITALTQIGAKVYGTDVNGTIKIDTDGNTFTACTTTPPPVTYTLTIIKVGQGTVTKNPEQASYNEESSVQLSASASSGWSFSGWSGDASGTTSPVTVTMTGNKTVTATFTPPPDGIVYTTKTGAKYHRAYCQYLSSSSIPIERSEAIRKGYTPCSVCKP